MLRRLSWIAVLVTAVLVMGVTPATAVAPFGPAEQLVAGCGVGLGDAVIASDGTTRGFAECPADPDDPNGPIWFFRDRPGQAPSQQQTPYTGFVLAAAWDGVGATYLLYQQDTTLKIAKRVESSGAYSSPTTLATGAAALFFTGDVVASAGKWWAVWSEQTGPGGEFAQTELFQAHTLLGTQGRTRITTTASNVFDVEPTLAYASGRVSMVWSRWTNPFTGTGQSDLRRGSNTGGGWSTVLLTAAGNVNLAADMIVYAGVTYVTWERDGRIVVTSNSSGTFASRTFNTPGFVPSVSVSLGKLFVAWAASPSGGDVDNRVFLAERSGGVWTGANVTPAPSAPVAVLAQGGKARVVYRTDTDVQIITQS
jgi:hypothetical protein